MEKKYYVVMNCIRMTEPDTYEKANGYFIEKLRKYEAEKAKILYGCNSYVIDGSLIYELICETK